MENKISLSALAAMIALATGQPGDLCVKFLTELLDIIGEALEAGESVRIKGLGTFKLIDIEPRKSVDVATGTEIEIPAHRRIIFVACKELAALVNSPFEAFEAEEVADDLPTDELMLDPEDEDIDTLDDNDEPETDEPAEENSADEETVIIHTEDEKITEPEEPERITEPDEPEEPEKITEPDESEKITEQGKTQKVANPENIIVFDKISMLDEKGIGSPGNMRVITFDQNEGKSDTPIPATETSDTTSESDSNAPTEENNGVESNQEEEQPSKESRESNEAGESKESGEATENSEPLSIQTDTISNSDSKNSPDIKTETDIKPETEENRKTIYSAAEPNHSDHIDFSEDDPIDFSEVDGGENYAQAIQDQPQRHGRFGKGFILGFISAAIVLAILIIAGIEFGYISSPAKDKDESSSPVAQQVPEDIDDALASLYTDSLAADSITEAESDNATEIAEVPTRPSDETMTVKKNEPKYDTVSTTRYLTTMAQEHYGNYNLWPVIYKENQAILGHPDRIKPGTKVVVPPLSKYNIDASNPEDIKTMKREGVKIYAKFKKKL